MTFCILAIDSHASNAAYHELNSCPVNRLAQPSACSLDDYLQKPANEVGRKLYVWIFLRSKVLQHMRRLLPVIHGLLREPVSSSLP
jgi:hypothetical protein